MQMPPDPKRGRKAPIKGLEVVIEARNQAIARTVAFLLRVASDIRDGGSFFADLAGPLEIIECHPASARTLAPGRRATKSTPNIPLDCMLAVKLARRRASIYAASKLWLSYQQVSIPGIDLDPTRSATLPKSPYPFDHVAYAQAIVLAYGVLEELGLDVRASIKNPSLINGVWNPVVQENLIKRLQDAGVDLREQYVWNLRAAKTRLERERPPRFVSKTPWSKWDVRDGFVEVVDAIAHVSWLRSKVSAHKSKYEFMRALSAYDVANAQYLARRLLLEAMGFWRTDLKFYSLA